MKIVINILKVIELIIGAIWGIIFGVLTPISLMYGGIVDESISQHFVLWLWLINSVVCYIGGVTVVMMKHYKTALCFHTVGLIVSLTVYGIFDGLFSERGLSGQNPAQLYMPIIFLFFTTLAITLIAERNNIKKRLEASREKQYEAAPSVLGGEYTLDPSEKEKKRSGKK